jgi:hypothetical protein
VQVIHVDHALVPRVEQVEHGLQEHDLQQCS